MSAPESLLVGVLADLDGAGALADSLQEAGRDRDAVLLRRRWRRWQAQRVYREPTVYDVEWLMSMGLTHDEAVSEACDRARVRQHAQDRLFRDYVRRLFGPTLRDVKRWVRDVRGVSHVVTRDARDQFRTACGKPWPDVLEDEIVAVRGKRVCRRCRAALPGLVVTEEGVAWPG